MEIVFIALMAVRVEIEPRNQEGRGSAIFRLELALRLILRLRGF